MSYAERPDDFAQRRAHLQGLSDAELHAYFWELVERITAPLIEEARSHTSPSIERSVLLRIGLSSVEARELVATMGKKGLLGQGAGRLVLELAQRLNIDVRQAGAELLAGRHWEALPR